MTNSKRILIVVIILAFSTAVAFLLTRRNVQISYNQSSAAGTPSGSNYVNITNFGPAPADFRPFSAASAWNVRLPDNPQNIDTASTAWAKVYAANTGPTLFMTEDNNAVTGCVSPCAGLNQSVAIYVATNSDPSVTLDCSNVAYGCYNDTLYSPVTSIPGTFHIPATARSGVGGNFGDSALGIIQPDGTELDFYGCKITRNWRNGDVIGSYSNPTIQAGNGCGVNGIAVANVVTGNGYNNSVSSGHAYSAMVALYNEVVPAGATINHAILLAADCFAGVVYPGSYLGPPHVCSSGQGIPVGSHVHLNLSHAQIDTKISQGVLSAGLRPFYYALHDYGAYITDGAFTAGCSSSPCFSPESLTPVMEDATVWLKNGGTNPWVPWYLSQPGAWRWTQDTGTPLVSFRADLFAPIANNFDIVSACYAQGTCSDSIPPGNPTPTPPPAPLPPPPPPGSLSLNKSTTASSTEASDPTLAPSMALDGNLTTRWSSDYSDPQWIQVDLGANYSVTRVILNWEVAFGSSYQIQVSTNGSSWTNVYSTTTGDGAVDDLSFNGTTGRYVRMNGTQRGTPYGYSLYEFSVYGTVAALVGDLNLDHIVNSLDWSIMNSRWFTSDATADLNKDGIVNAIDFSMLNANWFKTW